MSRPSLTFCLALGLVLVPVGALMAQPWQTGMFTAMAVLFMPLLAPANPMSYDTAAVLQLRARDRRRAWASRRSRFACIPPLSPAFRTRRLLALTLRDLRRLRAGRSRRAPTIGRAASYGRVDGAAGCGRAGAARAASSRRSSVGSEIIRLRRIARRRGVADVLAPALAAIRHGESRQRGRAPRGARAAPRGAPSPPISERVLLRARGSILAMSEALTQHAAYFDAGAPAMRFTEIDLFGVYVAPIVADDGRGLGDRRSTLRRIAARFGLLRHVWHPALFVFAVY